ncbi:Peroxiredoxin [Hyunsoonleella jejuensis]|uniref:Peroxiredoxin n=1 Tax=Hyunsoonleella jejuensis TaxID=419940 RepID=A0A1H9LFB8_9FLAO|nr:TlpA disulfide reductase family protein [Hyunsoonleella jejuensis]SER09633.1 Peroxiredoxin [Hyunsoonleella jejuensis]
MNKPLNICYQILLTVLCVAMLPCAAQNPHENHDTPRAKVDSITNYVIMKSWDHQREIYIAKGRTPAEADSLVTSYLRQFAAMDRTAGNDRIGVEPPAFRFDGWLNSDPLTLDDLKGNVVLVRWFTDTCPFCASSTPALNQLYQEYNNNNFKMIGVFHPKAGRDDALDISRVERVVEARDFKFPIAIDWDWRHGTLKDWWFTGTKRPGTSVTFILDKSGVVQFVHPGMEYHEDNGSELHAMCASDMDNIKAAIERLLKE